MSVLWFFVTFSVTLVAIVTISFWAISQLIDQLLDKSDALHEAEGEIERLTETVEYQSERHRALRSKYYEQKDLVREIKGQLDAIAGRTESVLANPASLLDHDENNEDDADAAKS